MTVMTERLASSSPVLNPRAPSSNRDFGGATAPGGPQASPRPHGGGYADHLTAAVQRSDLKKRSSSIRDGYRGLESGLGRARDRHQSTGVTAAEHLPSPDFRRSVP